MTQKFKEVYVDVLRAGDAFQIPAGYIHAVITLTDSSFIGVNAVWEDWINGLYDRLNKEAQLALGGGVDLKTILNRRERDLEMLFQLSMRLDCERRKSLDALVDKEKGMIEDMKKRVGKRGEKRKVRKGG